MKRRILTTAILATSILLCATRHALAAGFTLSASSTTAQTVSGTSTNTGTVNSGVTLSVSGSTASVTISGGTAGSPTTLVNSGTIQQTGTGRAVVSASTNAVLVIQNNLGATISTANNDTVAAGTGSTTVTSVSLTNAGTIQSAAGGQAVNFNKILTGSNSITNTGSILAAGSDAIRPGVNGIVINSGTIASTQVAGSSSDGVDVQNNTGIQITNSTVNGLIDGGRHGITGGALNNTVTFTTSITNNAGAIIRGSNGSGINLDGFNALQSATVINNGTITGNGVTGDGDGIDVDGLVNVTNTGIIRSINAFSATVGSPAQSEGISVGGGTIINSGTIEGLVAAGNTNAVGRGISLLGNDITTGPLAGTREAIYANAVVTNQAGGLIRGDSDSGIAVDGPASGFTVTINNNAGATIRGGATLSGLAGTNAAVRTGADNDTVNNAGTINGSSNGKAIDLGAGNNVLNITGGAASITGDISGGSGGTNVMTINPGTGNSFSYSGAISNFNTVEAKSGLITLSGASTYTGVTRVTGGILTLDGVNRISSASALDLNGGTLKISNGGGANGQTFASLSLDGSSTLDLFFDSSLTFNGIGTILTGTSLAVTGFSESISPLYAFRFLGDLTSNADFLTLIGETTINGAAAEYTFDGAYTDVVPVPEPATIGFGFALLGAAFARRRCAVSVRA